MGIKIDLRAPLKQLSRDLTGLQRNQIPYAAALALTQTARDIAAAETAQMERTFDKETPFTKRAFGVIPARKSNLTAVVFARDIQAGYLEPYLDGGPQALGSKKAILTPRDLALNQYGNIPKGKLVALKGRTDVFIGEVKTKHGMVGGVWQRLPDVKRGAALNKRIKGVGRAQGPMRPNRLKLLVQFTRPAQVTKRLDYAAVALKTANARLPLNWQAALAQSLRTTR